MLTASDLCHFTGSEVFQRWSILFQRHVMTEGVHHLAQKCSAFWLLDAIALHHVKAVRKDRRLWHMQFWTLRKSKGGAVLECRADSGEEPVVRQEIQFTDFFSNFDGESVDVWVGLADSEMWTVMLPSEY